MEMQMELDAALLARLQFGFTVAFHILFPTLTIGLGGFLVYVEAAWLRTGDTVFERLYRFWVKIFALAFGMGVVTGVVLSYEIGTNFSGFADATGNVLGPLFGYEVLTAFFLEAGFVGIMLFGWGRVSPRAHFIATLMVVAGTLISAFWIIAANSWMQTPAGYRLEGGRFIVESWVDIILNPSTLIRYLHMVLASYVTAMFVVAGVSALHLAMDRPPESAIRAIKITIAALAILVPAQIFAGDASGLILERHQPVKLAAIEGRWDTARGAPLVLFALPNSRTERNDFELAIPKLGSLIITHSFDGEVRGLKEVAPAERPPVFIVFWAFRVMVGIGFLALIVPWWGLWLWHRAQLDQSGWFLAACIGMIPLGFVATLAGWITAEAGRQPWIVYGLMRTADAISPVAASAVASSFLLFIVVYNILLVTYAYFVVRLAWHGPDDRLPVVANVNPVVAKRAVMAAA
jgi:cytochrome d ubiquinol oxidase subunit I